MTDTLTWAYTLSNYDVQGTIYLTTSSTPQSGTSYAVTDISGTISGYGVNSNDITDNVAITGRITPGGYQSNTNLVDSSSQNTGYLTDSNVVAFVDANGQDYALSWVPASIPQYDQFDQFGQQGQPATFRVTWGPSANYTPDSGATFSEGPTICYLRGTLIMTTAGEVAVEDLRSGDRLVTRFGPLRPVKWIGRQSFDGRFLGQDRAPVCFRAGSILTGVPARDLYVSPAHSMVIDDRLVSASLLVNGVTITQEPTSGTVDYFHVDLGVHDCVIADGAWSESYAEQDNRASFTNAAEFAELFPDHQPSVQKWCLPTVHSDGPDLRSILAKLFDCFPPGSITSEPDLHLIADGSRIDPSLTDGKTWRFEVPAGVRRLRLMSRASSPANACISRDPRRLGFCVHGITVSTPSETRSINADHPQFRDGVHRVEERHGKRWRWTDGDCLLPEALLAGINEPVTLILMGNPLPKYLTAPLTPAARLHGRTVIPTGDAVASIGRLGEVSRNSQPQTAAEAEEPVITAA